MKRTPGIILVLASLSLFFGLSSPLLYASQIGAFSDTPVIQFAVEKNTDSTLRITVSASSPSVPINALYIHLSYDTSLTCHTLSINEDAFPLVLEQEFDDSHKESVLALATPGFGFLATTTLVTFSCLSASTSNDMNLQILPDSRAYAADGLGTELSITQ